MADRFDPDPRASDRVVHEALRRGQRRRRAWRLLASSTVAATIAVVAVVAAVGSFGGGPTHLRTSPSATTSTTAPAKRPSATSSTTTATTKPPSTTAKAPSTTATTSGTKPPNPTPQTAACQSKQLRVSLTMQSGSMGTGLAQVILENTSASKCTLEGYPRVTLANSSGRTSGESTDTTPGVAPNPPLGTAPAPVTVSLAPNGQAVFWFTWQDNPVGSQTDASCVSPARETVTPPGSSTAVTLTQSLNTLACSAPLVEPIEPSGFVPNGLRGGA